MLVEFIDNPTGRFNLAYNAGDVVEIEDKTYVLKKYDSIKILEKQRHKIYNLSKNKSISYWTKLKK